MYTGKMGKNTGKVREKSGNFVSPEKWEPCTVISGLLDEICNDSGLIHTERLGLRLRTRCLICLTRCEYTIEIKLNPSLNDIKK